MNKNPYSLVFGKNPNQIISRHIPSNLVIDTFMEDEPSQQIFMITGIRGAGKTVFMTDISHRISENGEWVVVDLNPDTNLLESLAAKLSSENHLARIFQNAKINLSFFGFGLEMSQTSPITDLETAITKMLESLKKHGKTSDIRAFLNMETNEFNPYRKRLIKKGILNGDVRGYVSFTLPLFEQFVIENYNL